MPVARWVAARIGPTPIVSTPGGRCFPPAGNGTLLQLQFLDYLSSACRDSIRVGRPQGRLAHGAIGKLPSM